MATLPYDRERWMVQTFGGGGKRSQLCGQNPVFPPLKRPKTGFHSINGGDRFNGVLINNPGSINIPRCSPQISRVPADTILAVLAINSCQNPFPVTEIKPGLQHERQAHIVGRVPPAAKNMVMPTVQGPQAPILGLVDPTPLPSSVIEIVKTPPLNSQVKSNSSPPPAPPPLPLAGTAIGELLNSLAKRGLIKPTEETQTQPEPEPEPEPSSIGLEFDPALVKKRHESVINALYSDLPRQCSTCGLRFMTSGEHSRHMDWHVRKNRAKNNKRGKPLRLSRPWYPSSDEEASPQIPESWLHPEEIWDEKKAEELLVVHADYDQKLCALCNEAFEDFYCDSTEDWMYKGAAYMMAPNGGLGPIVHAKCLPEPPV